MRNQWTFKKVYVFENFWLVNSEARLHTTCRLEQYGFLPTFFEVKEIFSDSNSIFLWHESKDINKKAHFQNFS